MKNENSKASKGWGTVSSLSLGKNEQDAVLERSRYNKWQGSLWTEPSQAPQLVMCTIPRGCMSSHQACHPLWDLLQRSTTSASSGCADSGRQLTHRGSWEHSVARSEVPCGLLPCAAKLKPEELGVAKRLSNCCRKNLLNWHPRAKSAEAVSIQNCVIFQLFLHFSPYRAFTLHFLN